MAYSFDKQTHESKGKAGKILHPAGGRPHSGARKNKLRKALEAREDKVIIPVHLTKAGGGKVKGDKLEEGEKPKKRVTPKRKKRKPFEPFVTMEAKGGGKVKGYKKGGAITYRMTGGQVVDNSYD